MAPKEVTNFEKPKRKIIMTTVEMKKNLSLSGKKIHVYQPGRSVRFLWNMSHLPSSNISPLHFLFLFWLAHVCMILCI
jgi:hypothetical protein